VSSLGKGIASAGSARCCSRGYKVRLAQASIPISMSDPVQMKPRQHGEVYCHRTMAPRTDLDLGHYEALYLAVSARHRTISRPGAIYQAHHREGSGAGLISARRPGDSARDQTRSRISSCSVRAKMFEFVLCENRGGTVAHRGPALLRSDPPKARPGTGTDRACSSSPDLSALTFLPPAR